MQNDSVEALGVAFLAACGFIVLYAMAYKPKPKSERVLEVTRPPVEVGARINAALHGNPLAVLAAVACVAGLVGGLIGRFTGPDVDKLKDRIDALESDVNNLDRSVRACRSEVDDVDSKVRSCESDIDDLESKVRSLRD